MSVKQVLGVILIIASIIVIKIPDLIDGMEKLPVLAILLAGAASSFSGR